MAVKLLARDSEFIESQRAGTPECFRTKLNRRHAPVGIQRFDAINRPVGI